MGEGRTTGGGGRPFLGDIELRPLTLADSRGLEPVGLALGQGGGALEVAVTRAAHRPAQATMRGVWSARHGGRAVPLLLVTLYADRAALCGPGGDEPPVYLDLDPGQVERLCLTALAEPDRHAAGRFLKSVVPEVESPLPGLRNEGLFATHELSHGVPRRRDWPDAQRRAQALLGLRGRPLLEGLGYQVEKTTGQDTSILRIGENKVAIAIFLDRHEAIDVASAPFGGLSPISYALAKADAENLPYVFVNHGPALRIYPVAPGVGTGRRGRTETFIEVHLDLLPTDKAAYLWLLFSGEALAKGGSFAEILNTSSDYAAELGARLRDRVYDDVVPRLSLAIAAARRLRKPTSQDLAVTYEMTLTVLFRLLFIAYAEDKDLLPYRTNGRYEARSLKKKAKDLADMKRNAQGDMVAWLAGFDNSTSHWDEFVRLCRAVDTGKPREWGVPAYNGGLFSEDQQVSQVGALLAGVSIPNKAFGPILTNLLVDETPEGFGPVDFRSLGVREFGTIYEGLLESELSVAEVDLVVDAKGFYAPADDSGTGVPPVEKKKTTGKMPVSRMGETARLSSPTSPMPRTPAVRTGQIYLHNASGARKATGSYYTKDFAVEHLLDYALEPALDEHLARLDKMDDRKAGEAFFDFRVADIAMGSAHFLVSAVDRIERRLSSYLARRQLPDVVNELQRLKSSACEALGEPPDQAQIEDTQLLRRQIARRCLYGVDIKQVAVDLARLSLWIHTFVPGLPLSFLDHSIVRGNSLVGIATIEEVQELFGAEDQPLFADRIRAMLGPACETLRVLARLSDADARQIKQAREAMLKAGMASAVAANMFNILAASRLPEMNYKPDPGDFEKSTKKDMAELQQRARKTLGDLTPFHFPIAFPDVFLRDRPGFDVIVGNPPWEEAMCDVDEFWCRYMPGFQSLPQRERETVLRRFRKERPDLESDYERACTQAAALRNVLVSGPYPGMMTGHPDLYKAFCWRFWNLVCGGGRVGVVLPRSVFCAQGSTEFRIAVLQEGTTRLTYLLNNAGWVFPEVHPQYSIVLANLVKSAGSQGRTVRLSGPFRTLQGFVAGCARPTATFTTDEVLAWTDTGTLPLLPGEGSAEVFIQMRRASRLDLNDKDSWRARPIQGDINATWGKPLMDLNSEKCPRGFWPVYKGESFDIWIPDTGSYYAWAEPRKMQDHLFETRGNSSNNSRSAFFEFSADQPWIRSHATLPCMTPRIAFRDITNRTNTRTVVGALTPPKVFIANQAPYLLWPRGDEKDQAFLLGVLCSIPLDWYARRFVETHVNFHILNAFPIPRPGRDNPLWQRAVQLAGRLASPDERFAEWAEAVGVGCGPIPEPEKDAMIFELDAVVAHLYGLTEAHVRHIFETFHEGWDCQGRLDAVLHCFRQWASRV